MSKDWGLKFWNLLFDFWNFKVYFYQNKLTQILKDTAKHQGLRNQLVTLLKEKGITDKNVLETIKKIPRHLFLNSSFADYAYQDKAFPIGAGQTISQPYTVAFQSQLLEIKKDHKILEIGTGSGYQTAVLCLMGAKVYSIERQNELFKQIYIDSTFPVILKSVMDNPENTGIDVENDMLVFVMKDSSGGYVAVEGTIKDAAKFKQFNNKITIRRSKYCSIVSR